MARKSSKTARVMNLLAGGEEPENTVEGQQEGPEEGAAVAENAAPGENEGPSGLEGQAELVKASSAAVTDSEVREMMEQQPQPEKPDPVAELIRETLEADLDAAEEPEAVEPEIENLVQPHGQEADYTYINVMEAIVEDKVEYFMKQFDVCTCDRCVADAKALALTGLPPKYIVTAKSTVAPLLNFYTNKFIGQVTVELTKACKIVKDFPHHGS